MTAQTPSSAAAPSAHPSDGRPRGALGAVDAALLGIQRVVLAVSCALIIVGLFAEVVARYVFSASILGLAELILIPTLWMYFIGASYASRRGEHISANILDVLLGSERAKAVVVLIVAVISVVLSVILAYWGIAYLTESIARGASSNIWGMPLAIMQSAVTVGFLLMCAYAVLDLVAAVRRLRTPDRVAASAEKGV